MNINRLSVLTALSDHIGEKQGIKGKDLTDLVTGEPATEATQRCIRKVIEDLRLEGFHICGIPSSGYYMASSESDLNRTCLFMYARAMKTLTQIAAMKHKSLPDLKGQLNLLADQ